MLRVNIIGDLIVFIKDHLVNQVTGFFVPTSQQAFGLLVGQAISRGTNIDYFF